jgi:hypothetical protein
MARYWQSSTFNGFFVEGNRQDRTIAERLSESLEGIETREVIGAGIYIWLDKGDPKIRVKDLADRTLIELLVEDPPVRKKKQKAPKVSETAEGEEPGDETGESQAEETFEPAVEEEIPAEPGEREVLFSRIDEILSTSYRKVDAMPPELGTKLDLKLTKWQTPRAMAITAGEPLGGAEQIAMDQGGRRGGGGLTQILGLIGFVAALGIGIFAILTNQKNDEYYVYQPGTQFESIGISRGFINDSDELVIINVPTGSDSMWTIDEFRFARANIDTVETTRFISIENDELRIDQNRGWCGILEPAPPLETSTAVPLDVAGLQWNRNQDWVSFFETELNRAIVQGTLVREDDQLWLQSGDNFVSLGEWEFLTDEDRIRLAFAESRELEVTLEIQYIDTLAYGSERTAQSHRLFSAEIRKVMLD